jgi:hypothetical protein
LSPSYTFVNFREESVAREEADFYNTFIRSLQETAGRQLWQEILAAKLGEFPFLGLILKIQLIVFRRRLAGSSGKRLLELSLVSSCWD